MNQIRSFSQINSWSAPLSAKPTPNKICCSLTHSLISNSGNSKPSQLPSLKLWGPILDLSPVIFPHLIPKPSTCNCLCLSWSHLSSILVAGLALHQTFAQRTYWWGILSCNYKPTVPGFDNGHPVRYYLLYLAACCRRKLQKGVGICFALPFIPSDWHTEVTPLHATPSACRPVTQEVKEGWWAQRFMASFGDTVLKIFINKRTKRKHGAEEMAPRWEHWLLF